MNRTNYKNQYIKDNYDRISLVIPKGQKNTLKSICSKLDLSINEYIKLLIKNDLRTGKSKISEMIHGFSEEDNAILDKWQIPQKYREMIEDFSYSKEDGYFIRLKKGYINDVKNSRIILVNKTSELRMIINKSRKK